MENWISILKKFIIQATKSDLKTSSYPKEWEELKMRISFGMGAPARVPWIAFIAPNMAVSNGFYPVYLYYKDFQTLILAYGVSETEEFSQSWPAEIMNSTETITAFFNKNVPRYGDSFVFKAYKIEIIDSNINFLVPNSNNKLTDIDLESDLSTINDYYKRVVSLPISSPAPDFFQGLF